MDELMLSTSKELRLLGDAFHKASGAKHLEALKYTDPREVMEQVYAMGMCDAYANAAEALWATASHYDAESSGDANGFLRFISQTATPPVTLT